MNSLGSKIVYQSCSSPITKILKNAGYDDGKIYSIINDLDNGNMWLGFNPKTGDFEDMKSSGIIDPAKVSRVALENAASVAGTILLTEATIVDKPDPKQNNDPMMGMM